jgi:hypothetical protein
VFVLFIIFYTTYTTRAPYRLVWAVSELFLLLGSMVKPAHKITNNGLRKECNDWAELACVMGSMCYVFCVSLLVQC